MSLNCGRQREQTHQWGKRRPRRVHDAAETLQRPSTSVEILGGVDVRLTSRSCTNGTPGDAIGEELGADGVEELASDGDTHVCDVGEEGASDPESLVDGEGAVLSLNNELDEFSVR